MAARDCGKTKSRERDKGRRVCAPYGDAGVPAGHMEERTSAVSVDSLCAKAARCARAAIAPTHVEHEERRSTKREAGRVCGSFM